jgi:hypothetical protein
MSSEQSQITVKFKASGRQLQLPSTFFVGQVSCRDPRKLKGAMTCVTSVALGVIVRSLMKLESKICKALLVQPKS